MLLQSYEQKSNIAPEMKKPEIGVSGLSNGAVIGQLECVPKIAPPDFSVNGGCDMTQKFLKLIDSEKIEWLMRHPWAFMLLTLVARRARRVAGNIDGLRVGEALIGDHKSIGATRGQYRNALKFLVENGLLEIVETCRTRQSSPQTRQKTTTGTTTVGTKVKLIGSDIWDINHEANDHRHNHPTTTERPPNDHEEDRKKVKIKEKTKAKKKTEPSAPAKEAEEKIAVREAVFLTPSEHAKLLALHGPVKLELMLNFLDSYKVRNAKTYASDYGAMKAGSFVVLQVEEQMARNPNSAAAQTSQENINRKWYQQHISGLKMPPGCRMEAKENGIVVQNGMEQDGVRFKDANFQEIIKNKLRNWGIK